VSTVGVCARCAESLLWVAPWPVVGSVVAFSYEGFLTLISECKSGATGASSESIHLVFSASFAAVQ
jgi:hypothetical protein